MNIIKKNNLNLSITLPAKHQKHKIIIISKKTKKYKIIFSRIWL